ncbi:MAG TPA: hypothetical protein GX507_10120 [Clostridia bacterium]|nr:hypothetical protein [Clostridia bacterium]
MTGDCQRFLEAIGSIIEDMMIVVDARGQVLFSSEECESLLERSEIADVIHQVLESQGQSRVVSKETTIGDQGTGTRQVLWVRGTSVLSPDGGTAGAILFISEVSRARRTLAVASHEIKSPLVAVLGYLEILLKRYKTMSTEEVLSILLRCRDRVSSLIELSSGMLDLAKRGADEFQEKPEFLDLSAILDDVCEFYEVEAEKKGLEMTFEALPGVPGIYARRNDMWQVFSNLISNAIKYNRPGGKIKVNLSRTIRGYARIRVEDTGVGIAARHLPFIFDEFYRATEGARERRGVDGSGLGLAIVKRIVESYRGRIEVTSEVGKGTAFTVLLPLARPGIKEQNRSTVGE